MYKGIYIHIHKDKLYLALNHLMSLPEPLYMFKLENKMCPIIWVDMNSAVNKAGKLNEVIKFPFIVEDCNQLPILSLIRS